MQGRAGNCGNERLLGMTALLVEHDDLAVLDVAHIFGADDVERAGLRGEDRGPVEPPHHERPDAERIAGAYQLLVGERDQRIGAFERVQRIHEAVDKNDCGATARPNAG